VFLTEVVHSEVHRRTVGCDGQHQAVHVLRDP
jgi:hypothetical protein